MLSKIDRSKYKKYIDRYIGKYYLIWEKTAPGAFSLNIYLLEFKMYLILFRSDSTVNLVFEPVHLTSSSIRAF